jgi:hypothetical protein
VAKHRIANARRRQRRISHLSQDIHRYLDKIFR